MARCVRVEIQNPQFLSSKRMSDPNKLKAMLILRTLSSLYFTQRSYNVLPIVTRMVEISIAYGCSRYSAFALASFGSNVVGSLGGVDFGCSLSRMALSLVRSSIAV